MTKRPIKPFAFFTNTKGYDQDTGTFFIQPDSASQIDNMNVDAIGQWSARNEGYSNFTSQLESGARIDSLCWYTTDAGTDYLLCAVNGEIKSINTASGAVLADISTSFTAGQPVDFCTFNGNVYAASEGLAVQKWSGSGSMSAAGGWPVSATYDKPKVVEVFQNRLVTANFNGATKYPSHLILSDDLAPETYTIGSSATNAAIIQVQPGDGQSITALKTFHIPQANDEILFVFKNRSFYALEGDTPSEFNLYLVNPSIGALNNRCVVQVGNDVIFCDERNIYSVTTANDSGTIQPKALGSSKIKDTFQSLNLSATEKAWAHHLPERSEVWFAIPTGSNTECDTILVYSYKAVNGVKGDAWSVRKNTTNTCGLVYKNRFFTGSNDGYMREWHSSNTYAGTSINWKYAYPFFNFGAQAQNKKINECYAWFLLNGTQTISVKYEWRGGGNNTQNTVTKTETLASGSAAVFGSVAPPAGVYGTSFYGDGTILKKFRIPVLGNGEQLQFTVTGNTSDSSGPIFLGISGLVEYMGYSRRYN